MQVRLLPRATNMHTIEKRLVVGELSPATHGCKSLTTSLVVTVTAEVERESQRVRNAEDEFKRRFSSHGKGVRKQQPTTRCRNVQSAQAMTPPRERPSLHFGCPRMNSVSLERTAGRQPRASLGVRNSVAQAMTPPPGISEKLGPTTANPNLSASNPTREATNPEKLQIPHL